MMKNSVKYMLYAICVCIILYIGVFIGRCSLGNELFCRSQSPASGQTPQIYRINLNLATLEELRMIPGIGLSLAKSILTYRNDFGDFMDVSELQDVPGFSRELYLSVKEYFYVEGGIP